MKFRLVSFRPLCSTAHGRTAVKLFQIPPYIDGSCRREPDLQNAFPSISGLCRPTKFARHLRRGDRVCYMTIAMKHPNGARGWAIVAALEVIKVFDTHEDAARWYRSHPAQPDVPSNCMIDGSAFVPEERTTGLPRGEVWRGRWKPRPGTRRSVKPSMEAWDGDYWERVKDDASFVVTKPIAPLRLHKPRILTRSELSRIFGRVPITQTPNIISRAQFRQLCTYL